jgi:hypothetical protein
MLQQIGNSVHGCIQTFVTIAAVTKKMCVNRCRKAQLVPYGSCEQSSPRIVHLLL